jgi:predicted Rossmann fold nucleotide-binding protein DprA/Smf involved in DNA uptake
MLKGDWEAFVRYILDENDRRMEMEIEMGLFDSPLPRRKKALMRYMEDSNERQMEMLMLLNRIENERSESKRQRARILQAFWNCKRERAPRKEFTPYSFNKMAKDELKIPFTTSKRFVRNHDAYYPPILK